MIATLERPRFWFAAVVALCVMTFTIGLTGPTDLEGYAQMLNVGYVMDMMWQGHWLVQHNIERVIMSKPPLHTWLIAPFAALFGVNRLSMGMPSFLSVMGLGFLVFHIGRRHFGMLAGGYAALAMVLATPMMDKQITLVRTDPLFTLTIAFAAYAAWRAWSEGRRWTPFWVAAGLATLTKGPLGLLLAAGGLLAYFWEKRSDRSTEPPRGSHLTGIVLYLVISLGWFIAAYLQAGDELVKKQFGEELIGQAVGAHKPPYSLRNTLTPTGFLLARFLPFSPFLFYALWRVFRHPDAAPAQRRFERFLTCWLLLGVVLFSAIRHQRPDHLLPLWPACALLIGREMARLGERIGALRFARMTAVGVLIVLVSIAFRTYREPEGDNKTSRYSVQVERAAAALKTAGIDPQTLHHYDTPVTLQLYLKTCRRWETTEDLERLVNTATTPVDIALGPSPVAALPFLANHPKASRVFRWPEDEAAEAVIQVYRVTP